jgi:uncharacterized protein YceH (UPF0502 family)
MDPKPLDEVVRNIDLRLERVEQFLPTLATKEELRDAVASLATKDELREAVADLATKAELQLIRAELREEGERTRRHFDIVAEETRLIAEALDDHRERTDHRFGDVDARLSTLDRRVTRLESKRR